MYYAMTEQILRVFILELRKYWAKHPKYRDIVDHIQGKYSFRERPQTGIVVKNSSGNHVSLAADNFQGTVNSYVYLAHHEGYDGLSVEWVRENALAIHQNNGVFPSRPGIYFLEFCDEHGTPTDKEFFVDPLYDVAGETPLRIDATHYQLLSGKFLAGPLRVYRMPGNIPLVSPQNYTADPNTGIITLNEPLPDPQDFLSVDYRVPGESTGPWKVGEVQGLTQPIPGAVLGIGRMVVPGDRLAVVVQPTRQIAALEYGGKWELSLDFDVIARDVHTQRELLDRSALFLFTIARSRLSTMGIEISSLNLGGESEEVYDDTGDDYYYMGSFSLTVQTDWSVHVPLGIVIRRVDPTIQDTYGNSKAIVTPPVYATYAELTDEQLAQISTAAMQFQMLESLGITPYDPFYIGKLPGRFGVYGTGETLL